MATEEMIELLSRLTEEQANTYALVLTSHGVPYTVGHDRVGWIIRVPASSHGEALGLIEAYREENPRPRPFDEKYEPEIDPRLRTYSGVWVSLLLLAVHLAVLSTSDPGAIFKAAGASAKAIVAGEYFRTATALTLHGDFLHLAGNILGLALFATAVCNTAGSGLGWSMILAAGIAGNLANAWLVEPAHLSIGASTSVFGALGILAALQFSRNRRSDISGFRAWLPLAGGLALLAFLGSGEHSDVTAHLFGFVAGVGGGLLFAQRLGKPPGPKRQRQLSLLSGALLSLCWLSALS